MNNTDTDTNTEEKTKPTQEEIVARFQDGTEEFLNMMFEGAPDYITPKHEEHLRAIIQSAMTLGNVLGSTSLKQEDPLKHPVTQLATMVLGAMMVGHCAELINGEPLKAASAGLIKGTATITAV